jgi:F-type H+-transporting ATPase subunit b
VNFNLTLIGQSIAMIVFVWFCVRYIWPYIIQAIDARQKEIAEGLAAGEKGRQDLASAKTEAEKVIAAARDKARGILDQANTRGGELVEAAKAEGEAEKKRRLEAARAEAEVEINKARDELRGQVAAIAIAGAEKILGREIDAKAHRDLLDKLASDLK